MLTAPVLGQRRPSQERPAPAAPPKPPAGPAQKSEINIDNLLSADSYKIYGEIKNVGTLVSTGSIAELIDPITKLADPPKEFKALVKFINANAEMLADSRLVFATWPARAEIPNAFVAIELASAEDAAKFEPKLNRLLPTLLPTPTPTPSPVEEKPVQSKDAGSQPREIKSVADPGNPQETTKPPKPEPPPFVVTRAANLVFVTDRPFKFQKLRPAESKLLTEDPGFRQAHERFSTEPIFVFINIALAELRRAEPKENPAGLDAETQARVDAEKKAQDDREKDETKTANEPVEQTEDSEQQPVPPVTSESKTSVIVEVAPPAAPQVSAMAFPSLMSLLGGGPPEYPDAIGISLSQESEDYVIRSILIGPPNSKHPLIPFVPQLLAGRPLAPSAPSVLPDETEVILSVSLDLQKIHQEMLARLEDSKKDQAEQMRHRPAAQRFQQPPYDPFADFEKKGGFKIKEELLPALGGEIAVAGSLKSLQSSGFGVIGMPSRQTGGSEQKETEESKAQKKRDEESMPVVLISVRDREAARRLVPKILDGLGIGMAKMLGTSIKRDDTEMTDFAGTFAYAFVGDFFVVSTSPTVRHIVDSYLNHQTLSSNSAYRNFTRWQPSGVVGQLYVSPALMETMQKSESVGPMVSPAMHEYLLRLNPTPQAITYALSNDGFGALHELHLPKTLVLAAIAGTASASKNPPPEVNESVAIGILRAIAGAEETYKATEGNGNYGSLDALIESKLVQKDMLDKYGYRFDVSVSGNHFEVRATPAEYGKTGRVSFFVDSSGVLKSGDHGGGPASASDKPMQ